MIYLIGHRGAAGLAPENTLKSIRVAKKHKVDAIECDIQITKDKHIVLCHDPTLMRFTGSPDKISDMTLEALNTTVTYSGEPIPTLAEALETAGKTPLVIEGKGSGWGKVLARDLKKHHGVTPKVISSDHRELVLFSQQLPEVETYAINDLKPFEAIYTAKSLGFTGVSFSFWFYNPLTYIFARRAGLKMIMSPLNKPFLAWVLHALYPQVAITTDFPDRFNHHHRTRRHKKAL